MKTYLAIWAHDNFVVAGVFLTAATAEGTGVGTVCSTRVPFAQSSGAAVVIVVLACVSPVVANGVSQALAGSCVASWSQLSMAAVSGAGFGAGDAVRRPFASR